MKSNEVSLLEYKARETDFFKKHFEYIDATCKINREEHEYIDSLDGDTFSKKSDVYFDSPIYEKVREAFNQKREELKEKYKGYESTWSADFYTELTKESLNYLGLHSSNAASILEETEKHNGEKFHLFPKGHEKADKEYTLKRAIVAVDDYYYELVSDDGEYVHYSCVGSPWHDEMENS